MTQQMTKRQTPPPRQDADAFCLGILRLISRCLAILFARAGMFNGSWTQYVTLLYESVPGRFKF